MKINLIEFFIDTVGKYSDRIAIIDGERRLSFGELDVKVRRLANVIVDVCQCKNRPVAVFMPKVLRRQLQILPSLVVAMCI